MRHHNAYRNTVMTYDANVHIGLSPFMTPIMTVGVGHKANCNPMFFSYSCPRIAVSVKAEVYAVCLANLDTGYTFNKSKKKAAPLGSASEIMRLADYSCSCSRFWYYALIW